MPTAANPTPLPRAPRRQRPLLTPAEAGLPDPRPVTDYSVVLTSVAGHDRLTVTLFQPCVIRKPNWALIDCLAGGLVYAPSVTIIDRKTFYFDYPGELSPSVGFVYVPYQDMEVQNFQGGFVVSGGKWFRTPYIA